MVGIIRQRECLPRVIVVYKGTQREVVLIGVSERDSRAVFHGTTAFQREVIPFRVVSQRVALAVEFGGETIEPHAQG